MKARNRLIKNNPTKNLGHSLFQQKSSLFRRPHDKKTFCAPASGSVQKSLLLPFKTQKRAEQHAKYAHLVGLGSGLPFAPELFLCIFRPWAHKNVCVCRGTRNAKNDRQVKKEREKKDQTGDKVRTKRAFVTSKQRYLIVERRT